MLRRGDQQIDHAKRYFDQLIPSRCQHAKYYFFFKHSCIVAEALTLTALDAPLCAAGVLNIEWDKLSYNSFEAQLLGKERKQIWLLLAHRVRNCIQYRNSLPLWKYDSRSKITLWPVWWQLWWTMNGVYRCTDWPFWLHSCLKPAQQSRITSWS